MDTVRHVIDQAVNSLAALPPNTGLVVGVTQQDGSEVHGYGRLGEARAEPPDAETLFEIGSISKVFTTTLLAVMVSEGLLGLDDAVCDLVPALSHLPPEMTLVRLATHTAGLPKMPTNIRQSMRANRRNPFAAYTTADLLAFLSGHRRPWPAALRVSYSNVGVALLGTVLAERMGTSYEEAVAAKIGDPLGLSDTRIRLTVEHKDRLAMPHSAGGKRTENWDLPAFAGAGGLRSTANDLLRFLAANLGDRPGPLAGALPMCHATYPGVFPPPGGMRRLLSRLRRHPDTGLYEEHMALGWHVGRLSPGGRPVLWRHGATGGYRSFAGFVRNPGAGVVVLANRGLSVVDALLGLTSADRIGFRILETLDPAGRSAAGDSSDDAPASGRRKPLPKENP